MKQKFPKQTNAALAKAILIAGGQTNLSKEIGAYPQLVQGWASSSRPVPAWWASRIEKATGVPREELRPDIFA